MKAVTIDLGAVDGLPQRRAMCQACPGRREMRTYQRIEPHRCHTGMNAVCADALLNSPGGRWELLAQVDQENARTRRQG
jgi:hypothetical protein